MKTKNIKLQSIKTFFRTSDDPLGMVKITQIFDNIDELEVSYKKTSRAIRWTAFYGITGLFLSIGALLVLLLGQSLSSEAQFFFLLLLCASGGILLLALMVAISNLIYLAVAQKILLIRAEFEVYEMREELASTQTNPSTEHQPPLFSSTK